MNTNNLTLPTGEWNLIERFYPDYHSSDDVHRSDVLSRYFHNEINEKEFEEYFDTKTPNVNELKKEQEELDTYLFQRALKECILFCRKLSSEQISVMIGEDVKEDSKLYLMFGDEICGIFLTHDFVDVIDAIENDNIYRRFFIYDKISGNPLDLLSEAEGSDYVVLTKDEYETLTSS